MGSFQEETSVKMELIRSKLKQELRFNPEMSIAVGSLVVEASKYALHEEKYEFNEEKYSHHVEKYDLHKEQYMVQEEKINHVQRYSDDEDIYNAPETGKL